MPIRYTFPDETAIVTGGVTGIGRTIAEALHAAGAEVHVFDRAKPTDALASGIRLHQVDISHADAITAALATMERPASLLVNNAGITRDRTITKMSDAEWADVIAINLTGAFNMIRATAPVMAANGYGRIVNITSINGLRGKFGQANYTAAKAGLIGLTKTAAREFGRKGVSVNAVAPGMVMTEMAKNLPEAVLEQARADAVCGRLCTPEDIANGVLFLLARESGRITGEVLRIDSGQYI